MRIADWRNHLSDKKEELLPDVRKFSITYKHFSRKEGDCIYVGRSDDDPLARPSEYTNNRRNVAERTGRAHNFIQYKIFTGGRRKIKSFDEECELYHGMSEAYQREFNHPHRPAGRLCQVCRR